MRPEQVETERREDRYRHQEHREGDQARGSFMASWEPGSVQQTGRRPTADQARRPDQDPDPSSMTVPSRPIFRFGIPLAPRSSLRHRASTSGPPQGFPMSFPGSPAYIDIMAKVPSPQRSARRRHASRLDAQELTNAFHHADRRGVWLAGCAWSRSK